MKKSTSHDTQGISDLLKKLQDAYLGGGKKSEKQRKKEQEDEADRKFQEQLAKMLDDATGDSSAKSASPKKRKKAPEPDQLPDEAPEALPTSIEVLEPDPIPEPDPIAVEPPKKPAQKKPRPKKEPVKKKVEPLDEKTPAPIVEEVPKPIAEEVPEPIVEEVPEPIVEEVPTPIAEEVPEPIVEEVPEPIVEEVPTPIVEEVPEPIAEEVPEPIVEEVPEPIAEDVPAPIAEEVPEPIVEEVPEPIAEETPEPIVEEVPEPIVVETPEEPQVVEKPRSKATVFELPEHPAPRTTAPRTPPSLAQIKVSLPQKEPSRKAPAQKSNEPIRIIPSAQEPSRSSQKAGDSIVIRPQKSSAEATSVTRIRPARADKPTPTPVVEPAQATPDCTPIKIGKEVHSAPTGTEAPTNRMKNDKNTTIIPPTPIPSVPETEAPAKRAATAPESAKKPPVRKVANTPAPLAKKVDATQKKPAPRKPRVIHHGPVEDERLEEVLDEPLATESVIEEIPFEEPEEVVVPAKKPSIFQRRQMQKQQLAEQNLSALDLIRQKSGLSEDDVNLMFELGYENELGRLVGYENLKRLRSDHLKRKNHTESHHYRTAFGYRGQEFSSDTNRQGTLAAYLQDRRALILRLVLVSLCTLLLFFLDQPHYLGTLADQLYALTDRLPDLISTLLLIAILALSYRQILAGARSLFRFAATPYSVPAMLVPFTLVYDLVLLIHPSTMLRVNCLVATAFLLMTLGDVLRLSCELRTLRLLSEDGEKAVLVPDTPRKKKLRRGNKIVRIVNDDLCGTLYRARRAEQTVGFFRRFNYNTATRPVTVLLASMLALATLSGFLAAILTSSGTAAISLFMTVLLLTVPTAPTFGYFYTLYRANRVLSTARCALVGEEAVEEYGEEQTVVFRDTAMYEVDRATEIAVRDGDFRPDLRLASALFRKLGGAHAEQFGAGAPMTREEPPISIVRIQEFGVEAVIDNRYHVLAGSAEFLRRGGVRVPAESTDRASRRTPSVALTYVAVNGVLKLSYEIEYSVKPSFEELVRDLAEDGTEVAIFSYDPNLNEAFLQKNREDGSDPVQVIKPGRFEEDKPLEIADTGAVALGSETDLVYPLHAARRVRNARRFCWRLQMIATLLGCTVAVLLTVFNPTAHLGVLPILCYQLLWTVVLTLSASAELNEQKLRMLRS